MSGRLLTPGLAPSATLTPSATLVPFGPTYGGGRITPQQVAIACGTGGAYIDVTGYIAGEVGVTYGHGRTDQFADTTPGTFSFTLNNLDGRFTPGNPTSPLARTLTEGMGVCWLLGGRLVHTTILALAIPPADTSWDQITVTCDDMLGDAGRHDLTTLADGLNQHSGQLLMWLLDDATDATSSPEVHGDGLGAFTLHSSNPASTTQALAFGQPQADGLPGTALTLTAAPGETNWYGTQYGRTDVVSSITYPHPPASTGGTTPTGFYDIAAVTPVNTVTLALNPDNPLQCAVKSPDTGQWYATQAINGSNGTSTPYETTRISRLDAAGNLLDTMTLTDAGHGGGIGLEYTASGMYIWTNWYVPAAGGAEFDVVRVKYVPGTYTRTSHPAMSVKMVATQLSPSGYRTDFLFDTAHGYVMGVEEGGRLNKPFRRWILTDFLNGIVTQSGATVTPADQSPLLQGWQGVGDAAFVYTGAQNGPEQTPPDPPRLWEYRWTDGTLVGVRDLTGIGANSSGAYTDNWYEPQSVSLYQKTAASAPVLYLGMTVGAAGNRSNPLSSFTLAPLMTSTTGGVAPAVTSYGYGWWNMWVYPGSTVNLAVTPKFATGGGYSDSYQILCTPSTVSVKGGAGPAVTHTYTADEVRIPHYVSMHPYLQWQTNGNYWALFIDLYIDQVAVAAAYWLDGRHGTNVGALQSADISPVMVNVSVTTPATATAALSGTVQRVSHTSGWTGDESNALYNTLDERRAVLDYIANEISSTAYAPAGTLSEVPIGFPDVAGRSILDVYNDIIRTEQGHLFSLTTGTLTAPVEQIQLRPRDRPATVKATFDAVTELDGLPSFVRNITNVANTVQVTGPDTTVTVTDPTVATITSRYISSGQSETILAAELTDLREWGQDRLTRGKNIGIRAETFTVDAMTTPADRSADLLALVPGDRVRLTGLPADRLGFSTWDGWLLGVTETHTQDGHKFTLALQPVLADAAKFDTDRYDADGDVTIATAVAAADTTITVTVASGVGVSADVPYGITVDAEQMTVTAVTGSTLTVTRGVASTTAAGHAAGAAVEAAPAAVYAF